MPIETHVSTSADDAIAHAAKAAANGRDLVAAGGDGTVGAIAGVAADHSVRLAIVPCGSGNDFATSLGYERGEPGPALAVLGDAGVDRTIDLGRVNDRWYCSVTATGFDSEANRWANGINRLSGTPLYVAAVLRTLATYKPHPMRVTVDGEVHELRAWMVSVGNSTTYGGGMRITPDARLDDGLVDVCAIDGAVRRPKFLASLPKVFKGTHVDIDGVHVWRGANVIVESLDEHVPIEVFADGERVGPLPATMRAAPNALTVRVPSAS
jgi:diacylglycerol kinase (ATP)